MRTKTEERRQSILRSAIEVFQEVGYEHASMQDIAVRLGYSKATLYSYFASKSELFHESILQAVNKKFEHLHASLVPKGSDLRETLVIFGVRVIEIIYSPQVRSARRLLIASAEKPDSDLARRCHELGPVRTTAILATYLKQLMEEGELRSADPMVASLQLRGLIEAEWLDAYLFGTLEKISKKENRAKAERAVDTFLRAYLHSDKTEAHASR